MPSILFKNLKIYITDVSPGKEEKNKRTKSYSFRCFRNIRAIPRKQDNKFPTISGRTCWVKDALFQFFVYNAHRKCVGTIQKEN